MNKKQIAARERCRNLLLTAIQDIDHGDRTDALDAIRMAQRELRDSMPPEMVNFLPGVEGVLLGTPRNIARVVFADDLSNTQVHVIKYTLNQLARKGK